MANEHLRIRTERTLNVLTAAGASRARLEFLELFTVLQENIEAGKTDPKALELASLIATHIEGRIQKSLGA